MSRLSLLFLVAVAALVCEAKLKARTIPLSSNPGVVVRITEKALDSFFEKVGELSSAYAHKFPIPDAKATVSGVDLCTKNIRITHFPPPRVNYRLVAPNKVVGQLRIPALGVEGPFNASRRVFITTQHDSGSLTFNCSDAKVDFTTVLGEFENGIPKVDQFQCTASLGPANLNVRNAKERFAIEVLSIFAKGVRPAFNTQVCKVTEKLVNTQLNRLLSRIPNVIEPNDKVSIKFQAKPVIASNYIDLNLHAKVITDTVSPHVPAPFAESPNSDTMIALFVSDAIVNDLLYQSFINKLLEFTIDQSSQPILYDLIRLTCAADQAACLGNVAPDLAAKFGADAAVEAVFKASKAPEVEFVKDKATFTAAITAELSITPKNGSQKYHEATAAVDLTGTFKVKIQDGTAYAKVDIEKVVVHIDEEHNKKWEEKITGTIEKVVEDSINAGCLFKGLPLRLPFGVGLEEPLVSFQPHTLLIQTGFVYKTEVSAEKK